jgi:hypothetical protein
MQAGKCSRASLVSTALQSTSPIRRHRKFAFFSCLLPAGYFASIAVFALIHYHDFASAFPQFLRYILAPGLVALILVASAYLLSVRTAFTVGASMTAILAAFFAYETLMSVRVLTILIGNYAATGRAAVSIEGPQGLQPGDTVGRLNTVMGAKTLPDALLGGVPYSHVVMCRKNGVSVSYKADRYGFNNPDSVFTKPVKAMIVGDSFIEGLCQDSGKDVTSVLRQWQPESASFGLRGAGPLFELAVLGRIGTAIKPRQVVIAFYEGNDWENLAVELKLPWLQQALTPGADFGPLFPSQELLSKSFRQIDEAEKKDNALRDVLFRTNFVRNYFALNQTATQLGLAYPKAPPDIPEYSYVLSRARALTSSWGGTLHLLYIPQKSRYIGVLPHKIVHDQLHHHVASAARQNGIAMIDLVEDFAKHPDPASLYAVDSHLSETGAAYVAEAIARVIEDPLSN